MRKILIDCRENIPCDPCRHACPKGAIKIEGGITDLPVVRPERCTGCGICVAACPGQACFLVDEEFAPGRASVDFPYEFLPLPVEGMTVEARDNEGNAVCGAIVEKVILQRNAQHTAVVRVSMPKEYAKYVRGMKPLKIPGEV
ncbi:MAG TPA: 4Fe-4S dicluster domain-containing protein [Clostridia bacterium]|nr:4Fe-4S dicluster domain-containing protein [Clostridia bacterium]